MGVTFGAGDWREAQEAWAAGEFGQEWDEARGAARTRGFIFPPSGSRHDDWDDEHPSQRAILYRAVDETPALLLECIGRSRSWSGVVAQLTAERDVIRRDRNLAEDDERAESKSRRLPPQALGQLLAAAQSHRLAQLEAAAAAAREVVRLEAEVRTDYDGELGEALLSLEGLLLELGDGS